MQTLEILDKKIRTAGELLSVVKTMKILAAANIRQYERAVLALESYRQVVDNGWQALFRYGGVEPGPVGRETAVVIIVGTDQGMCGQFNEMIVATALDKWKELRKEGVKVDFWSIGEKIAEGLKDGGAEAAIQYPSPGNLHTVKIMVGDMTEKLEEWKKALGTEHFYLCHNTLSVRVSYSQAFYPMLPLDRGWVDDRTDIPWPAKCIPLLGLSFTEMFRHLFRQYLYISLYRALVQSLVGENSARLAAMQAAEKNITELEADLRTLHREQRQMSITNELLDIISGFEALSDKETS